VPRSGKGVGGGSRLAIRGFARLLTHLPATTRDRLESAFQEVENLVDFHLLSTPEKITRRRISGILESPVLTVENTILGASVSWLRLNDPKIVMYEVHIDSTNVFPNPNTFTVREPFFSVDNITSRQFARVRGVRIDGLVGNFSDTVTLNPSTTAPTVHTFNFYQTYDRDEDPLIFKNIPPYGGERNPNFYTIMEHSFYPTRDVGGMMVFGYVSNRLTQSKESNIRPWDRVRFTVNGEVQMENYFCHWTDAFDEPDDTPGFIPPNGEPREFYFIPMSFYGRGGYTASFGPTMINYPAVGRADGPRDPRLVSDQDAGTSFYWQDIELVKRPTRWDESIIGVENIKTPTKKKEAANFGIKTTEATSYLKVQDFGFDVPDNVTITGIKALVKRRSHAAEEDDILIDRGKAVLNRPLAVTGELDTSDILKDTDFGRHLRVNSTDTVGIHEFLKSDDQTVGIANTWTVSTWINFAKIVATTDILEIRSTDPASNKSRIQMTQAAGNLLVRVRDEDDPVGDRIFVTIFNLFDTVGRWYHVAATFNAAGTLRTYVDGVLEDASTDASVIMEDRERSILINETVSGKTIRIGQYAIWNSELSGSEISELFNAEANLDYRENSGAYTSSANLQHYYFFFPEESDIRDFEIRLVDSTNTIRTDIDNKAVDELWPRLAQFYNSNTKLPSGRPLAVATGIPHDSVTGVGYQVYGGVSDLWGAENDDFYADLLNGSSINSPNFGIAIRAQNKLALTFPGDAFVDHAKLAVFWQDPNSVQSVNLKVEAESVNQFYIEREIFGGIFNGIETGEKVFSERILEDPC